LTFMTRTTNFQDHGEREKLRKNFQFCWDNLGQQYGVLADIQCKILQFWGRLEYGKLGSAIKGRDLWYTVMDSADNATKAVLWIEFAHLEMQRGIEPARKIYKKGVSSPNLDDLENVASSWIQFERCYGSIKQLKAAQEFCFPILRQALMRKRPDRKKKDEKPKAEPETKDKTAKRRNKDEVPETSTKKQKPDLEVIQEIKNVKLADTSKDSFSIFLSNLLYEVEDKDIIDAFPELTIKSIDFRRNNAGKSRGFCTVELGSEQQVDLALTFDRRPIKDRPVFISKVLREKEVREQHKPRYPEALEGNKLFVKGLPFSMTKDDLIKLFAPYGQLKDVRLVTHRNGKSKGLAYVDFEKSSDASTALLKTDQKEIGGHKISVAISDPPPKAKSKPTVFPKRNPDEAKPRMSFIPTSVQKKAQQVPPVDKKSNQDFRNMLLGKK